VSRGRSAPPGAIPRRHDTRRPREKRTQIPSRVGSFATISLKKTGPRAVPDGAVPTRPGPAGRPNLRDPWGNFAGLGDGLRCVGEFRNIPDSHELRKTCRTDRLDRGAEIGFVRGEQGVGSRRLRPRSPVAAEGPGGTGGCRPAAGKNEPKSRSVPLRRPSSRGKNEPNRAAAPRRTTGRRRPPRTSRSQVLGADLVRLRRPGCPNRGHPRFGDEVEGTGCGGGVECAVSDDYDGTSGPVLEQDRPLRVPGRRMRRALTWV
jgi:hypothetical protein